MKRQTWSEKPQKSPTANNHMGGERRNSDIFCTDEERAEWAPNLLTEPCFIRNVSRVLDLEKYKQEQKKKKYHFLH